MTSIPRVFNAREIENLINLRDRVEMFRSCTSEENHTALSALVLAIDGVMSLGKGNAGGIRNLEDSLDLLRPRNETITSDGDTRNH